MDKRVFEAQAQLDADIELAENSALLEFELRQALQDKALDDIIEIMCDRDFEALETYTAERGVDIKEFIRERWDDDGVFKYFVAGYSQYSYRAITTLCSYFDIELWGMSHE